MSVVKKDLSEASFPDLTGSRRHSNVCFLLSGAAYFMQPLFTVGKVVFVGTQVKAPSYEHWEESDPLYSLCCLPARRHWLAAVYFVCTANETKRRKNKQGRSIQLLPSRQIEMAKNSRISSGEDLTCGVASINGNGVV